MAPGNPVGLAAAIEEVLARPAWARRLAENALRSAGQLDYLTCASPLVKKFSSLLEKHGAARTSSSVIQSCGERTRHQPLP